MPLLNLNISQFLWIFVATNILKKLKPNILFLKFLASGGLSCYRVPEDADLRKLEHRDSSNTKKNHSKQQRAIKHSDVKFQHTTKAEFNIKSADLINLELKRAKIYPWVLQNTVYGEELEWVVDFSFISLISFIIIELIFYSSPKTDEYNISLLWVILVIIQCLYLLLHLTTIYFTNKLSSGEQSICLVSGCIFFLLSMLIITYDGTRFDLGMHKSLQSWSDNLAIDSRKVSLLDANQIYTPTPQRVPAYTIVVKLVISTICAFIGGIFTFPGFRFGQLHESYMAKPSTSSLQKLIHNFNYLSPLLVIWLWAPSISREALKRQQYVEIDDVKFERIRIGILVFIGLLRFWLVRTYAETFLDSVTGRINRLRYRGGITTNKAVQMTISSVNNYVNVVSLQYLLPALICLFTSIMHSALGGNKSMDWTGVEVQKFPNLRGVFGNQTFIQTAEHILVTSRRFLASDIPKNVSGFATWWFHFAWFYTSTAGIVYHKYFTH